MTHENDGAPALDLQARNRRDTLSSCATGPPAAIRQRDQARRATSREPPRQRRAREPDARPFLKPCRSPDASSIGRVSPSRAPRCICLMTLASHRVSRRPPPVRATTAADGRFRFTIDRTELASGLVSQRLPRPVPRRICGRLWTSLDRRADDRRPRRQPPRARRRRCADHGPFDRSRGPSAAGRRPCAWSRSTQRRLSSRRGCRRLKGIRMRLPSFQSLHEMAAGQPLDVDSTGQDRLRRTIPAPRCRPRADCLAPDRRAQDPDAGRAGDDARRGRRARSGSRVPKAASGSERPIF